MSARQIIPRDIYDRVRAAYDRGRRASLVRHSCFALAVREWMKARPGDNLRDAEAAVQRILGDASSADTARELAGV
jgi:hypothetical protein